MIYVKRIDCPEVLDLSNIESEAFKEYEEVIKYFMNNDRKFEFKAYSKGNVKEQLEVMFNNKCAYCESIISNVSYGDIEHFRPKTAYHSIDGETLKYPGYYWLAMDWNNLLLACDICNRSFKKNKFPIVDESKRKKRHDDNVIEEPLLIDPSNDELKIQDYIYFTEEGIVKYKDGLGNKGHKSIENYGLHRPKLTETRKILAKEIEDKKTQILGYLQTINTIISSPNPEIFKDIIEINLRDLESVYTALKNATLPSSPYLSLVRNLTSEFFKTKGDAIESLIAEYKEITNRERVGV